MIISPPMLRNQILVNVASKKLVRLKIHSYYDWATVHEVFAREEYGTHFFAINESVVDFYRRCLEDDLQPLILDLGANIGVASSYFASVYPMSAIVAVEPSIENFRLLKSNIAKLKNVTAQNRAIGPESGVQEFFDPGLGNNAFRTFGNQGQLVGTVEVASVNDLLKDRSAAIPFIAKIDIEGFENQLFSKNIEWVDRFKVIVIEIHDWMLPGGAVSSNFFAAIGGKNRDLVFVGENIFSIRND